MDYTDGTYIYLASSWPTLVYDASSDPSGYGTITCTMNCDTSLCCYNAATGADTIGLYCDGDSDDHFYFGTADEVSAAGCEVLTLYVAASN